MPASAAGRARQSACTKTVGHPAGTAQRVCTSAISRRSPTHISTGKRLLDMGPPIALPEIVCQAPVPAMVASRCLALRRRGELPTIRTSKLSSSATTFIWMSLPLASFAFYF